MRFISKSLTLGNQSVQLLLNVHPCMLDVQSRTDTRAARRVHSALSCELISYELGYLHISTFLA